MNQNDIIPPLRSDLTWEEMPSDAEFPFRLHDDVLGHVIKVDRRGRIISALLDKNQTLSELKTRISEHDGEYPKEGAIERIITVFQRCHLFESEETRDFFSDREDGENLIISNPDKVPMFFMKEKHSCIMCGGCCGGHNIGPLNKEFLDFAQGEIHDRLVRETQASRSLFYSISVNEQESEKKKMCCFRNGSCIFLNEDALCIIHGKYGESSKPLVCRMFPLYMIAAPDGIYVGLQHECRSMPDSMKKKSLSSYEKSLRQILPTTPMPTLRPVISLDSEKILDYREYQVIEHDIISLIEKGRKSPWNILIGINDILSKNSSRKQNRSDGPAEVCEAFFDWISGFYESLQKMKKSYDIKDDRIIFHTDSLDRLLDALEIMPFHLNALFSDRICSDIRRIFRSFAVNFWFLKEPAQYPDLITGQTSFVMRWFFIMAAAISEARRVRRYVLTGADLVNAMVAVNVLFRNKKFLLAQKEYIRSGELFFFSEFPSLVNNMSDFEQKIELPEMFLF